MCSQLTKAWLVTFALGTELLLLLMICAWMLRAVSPETVAFNITATEMPARRSAELERSLVQAQDREGRLRVELVRLQTEVAARRAACTPALPADRWQRKDLDLLTGCWLLGHEVGAVRGNPGDPNREENCTTRTGRICFDGKSGGQREQIMDCPISGRAICKAPISVKFNEDGTLATTQPYVQCEGAQAQWLAYSLKCERIDDSTAVCHSSGFPGFPPRDYEFRREP